jgi:hypothetical protein
MEGKVGVILNAAALGSVSLLVGCATGLPAVNAIPADRIDQVLGEIKRQVSIYETRTGYLRLHPDADTAMTEARKAGFRCGSGLVDFELVSVKMELTTTTDKSYGGSIGFKVPVSPGSVGGSVSGSREIEDTQELVFPLYNAPVKTGYVYSGDNSKPSPISDALLNLRRSLILGATKPGVCFYTYDYRDPKSDEGGTYKLGLTVTDDAKAGIEVELGPVAAGGGGEVKSATGNTLTVSFRQVHRRKGPHNDNSDGGLVAPHT